MKKIRVASGLGFYGDSWRPVRAAIERGEVQYVCSDHLAELTLAILQKDRMRDPKAGFNKDLIPMLLDLYPLGRPRGVKFILNAGGLNPRGAQEALQAALSKRGLSARIAVVTGDDVLGRLTELTQAGETFAHLDTGADIAQIRDRIVFANAYLGAMPLVKALRTGADIVVTGRVADAALFLAPLIHEFGWGADDYDKLAQGLVVGHLLECSGQGSGGNFGGDWATVPDLAHIGYPIAEVSEDGAAIITKAPGTGGKISFDTVRQQLLYEVHDPRSYFSPDVVLDMSTLKLTDLGKNRVRVTGATGKPRPATLKIVAGYEDGYMGHAMLGYSWPDALKKARAAAEIIKVQLQETAVNYDDIHVEYLGYDSLLGPLADPTYADELNEVYMRVAIRTRDKRAADGFGRLFPPIALSGPPFVSGLGGINPARQLLGLWPTRVTRGRIEEKVEIHVVDAVATTGGQS